MMRTRMGWAAVLAVGLLCGPGASDAWAIRLDDAAIFIEINDTDGDAGIQIFLDGEGWDTMQVFAPNGEMVLGVAAAGNVGFQGVTELFLESAEPSFDEQPLEEFLALFPPGVYIFDGATTEGTPLRAGVRLTHRIPEAPVILSPEEEGSLEVGDAVIEWERVPNPPGGRIKGYEVIVELDDENRPLRVFRADMGSRATRVTVPSEFLQRGRPYKVEVIAIETTGNRTISETEFETE